MILKFFKKSEGNIQLDSDKAEIIDITNDFRTKLLPKDYFLNSQYHVDENIYFVKQPLFIHLAKIKNRSSIEALSIDYKGNKIIIVSNNAYVFYNNKSIEVDDYSVSEKEFKNFVKSDN